MVLFFTIILALTSVFLALRLFLRADTKTLAKTMRQLSGAFMLVIAAILILTVRFAALSIPFLLLGLLLLFGQVNPFARLRRRNRASGQTSSVTSEYFKMTLNHQSGQMAGEIRKGELKGQHLEDLSKQLLKRLYLEIIDDGDDNSLRLLEAYLDSEITGWREDFDAGSTGRQRSASASGTITEEEAYEILGLVPGASVDTIREAHRRLIMKLHPDRGGSTALAAKINEAKDFLLANHSSNS